MVVESHSASAVHIFCVERCDTILVRSTPTPKPSLAHVLYYQIALKSCACGVVAVADVSAEDIAHLEELALTLRRRLRVLEMQAAGFGALVVPAHIVLDLENTRRELRQTLADL